MLGSRRDDGKLPISFTGNSILVDLSNSCPDTDMDSPNHGNGIPRGRPGESVLLDFATAPEPATVASIFTALIPSTFRPKAVDGAVPTASGVPASA